VRGEERPLAAPVAGRDEQANLAVIWKDAGEDNLLRRGRRNRGGQSGAGDNGKKSRSHLRHIIMGVRLRCK
jgi:hypothetical protein